MITLYRLKQSRAFRCIYKNPAWIKNIILMVILGIILVGINFFYFKSGNINTAVNILFKGLNSNTFNYL